MEKLNTLWMYVVLVEVPIISLHVTLLMFMIFQIQHSYTALKQIEEQVKLNPELLMDLPSSVNKRNNKKSVQDEEWEECVEGEEGCEEVEVYEDEDGSVRTPIILFFYNIHTCTYIIYIFFLTI
jgi:hypothetical protein